MGLRGPKPELIDEGAFLSCSRDSDYWCGILATEGSICFGRGRTVPLIRYGAIDIEHVSKFRDFVGSKRRVALVDRITQLGPCKYGLFAFTHSRVGEFLINNGITPKKSLTLRVSERLAASPDFWRGAIDGDGSVGESIKLSGCSFAFIEQFAQFCCEQGLDPCISLQKPVLGTAFGFNVAFVNRQFQVLAKLLYGERRVSLDRKQVNADSMISSKSGSYPRREVGSPYVRYGKGVVQAVKSKEEPDESAPDVIQ